jgi:predicted HTH transcriptional regulator
MREVADDILVKPNEKDLEILESFFEVAKSQNWVSPSDILAIQKEYDNLKGELKGKKKDNPGGDPSPIKMMPERQEKILAFLKEVGRAQVWQVKEILPDVTKRTLRRDFEHMLNQGLIERMGEKNNTFYQIKINES